MNKKNKSIQIIELGKKGYQDTLKIQELFFNKTIELKKSQSKRRKSNSN